MEPCDSASSNSDIGISQVAAAADLSSHESNDGTLEMDSEPCGVAPTAESDTCLVLEGSTKVAGCPSECSNGATSPLSEKKSETGDRVSLVEDVSESQSVSQSASDIESCGGISHITEESLQDIHSGNISSESETKDCSETSDKVTSCQVPESVCEAGSDCLRSSQCTDALVKDEDPHNSVAGNRSMQSLNKEDNTSDTSENNISYCQETPGNICIQGVDKQTAESSNIADDQEPLFQCNSASFISHKVDSIKEKSNSSSFDSECEAVDLTTSSGAKAECEPGSSPKGKEVVSSASDVHIGLNAITPCPQNMSSAEESHDCNACPNSNMSQENKDGMCHGVTQSSDEMQSEADSSLSGHNGEDCTFLKDVGFPEFFKGHAKIGKYISVKGDFTLRSSEALIESPSLITPFLLKELDCFPQRVEQEEVKSDSKDFFQSSVGEFLIGLGFSRVNEWYQRDIVIKKIRQAKKEGRSESLDEEIKKYQSAYLEAKKANEPFTFPSKRCDICDFVTESAIVLERHLLSPHTSSRREYICSYCSYMHRDPKEMLKHMKLAHDKVGFIQPSTPWLECMYCSFETNSRAKLSTHVNKCAKFYNSATNQAPPKDFDFPCLTPKPITVAVVKAYEKSLNSVHSVQKNRGRPKKVDSMPDTHSNIPLVTNQRQYKSFPITSPENVSSPGQPYFTSGTVKAVHSSTVASFAHPLMPGQCNNQYFPAVNSSGHVSNNAASSSLQFPYFMNSKSQNKAYSPSYGKIGSVSHTVLKDVPELPPGLPQPPKLQGPYPAQVSKPSLLSETNFPLSSLVVCEICDGYIRDMEQLRTHMQMIHKVKIHPKVLVSRPPLNCQKCQWRFFTDQGLERHLLGAHGLVTSNMQDLANKSKDSGCCTICGRIYASKLVAHMNQAHKITLKPAHLSYKCTVCSATFNLYRLFENHVYLVHSRATKRPVGNGEDSSASSCKKYAKSGGLSELENHIKTLSERENGVS